MLNWGWVRPLLVGIVEALQVRPCVQLGRNWGDKLREMGRVMRRGPTGVIGVIVLLGYWGVPSPASGGGQSETVGTPGTISPQRALLDEYCVTCHNGDFVRGTDEPRSLLVSQLRAVGLALDDVDVDNVSENPEIWERVVRKLRVGAMPPQPRPRPDKETYDGFRRWLEDQLDRVAQGRPDPGRTQAFHRLNQTEYRNVIRDLLDLEVDVAEWIPADAPDRYGFDNNAGALSLSPALLESYVSSARKLSRLVIGRPPAGGSVIKIYDLPLNLIQDNQQSEDLPFGSRGGTVVRHHFPVDGEYLIKVRLRTNYVGYVRGIDQAHDVEVRLDGRRIRNFTFGGEAPGTPAPMSFAGNIRGDDEWESYTLHAGDDLEVRIKVDAGPHLVGVSFPRETWEEDGVLQPRQTGFALAINDMPDSNPALDGVEISGPFTVDGPGETPARRKVFTCVPSAESDEQSCAREILATLARRAYRRPVTETDVAILLKFFDAGRSGGSFDEGIGFALERVLADPEFLYRIENDPIDSEPGRIYGLTDIELASRLSFFLWSSMPDDELLAVAERGALADQAVLEQQVRRMLADERATALVENFAGQWLHFRNIEGVYPDPLAFPQFDENLRDAYLMETQLFLESLMAEDRSVLDLLRANYTFVNERLAEHYGIPKVYGNRFRKVIFPEGERAGLLNHGSVMTVTSYPNRTSPVLRGKWVLENLLGAPPPEPPPNVPTLEEENEDGEPLSMRQAMVRHRENPACAVCHAPMDPIGFSLENFNAIGEWRQTSEAGTKIDASGTLPDGASFEGPIGLRDLLLDRPGDFVGTVTEKLMGYALGRGLEYYDAPTVRKIVREAAGDDYRWSSVVLGIVKSTAFQMRRSDS